MLEPINYKPSNLPVEIATYFKADDWVLFNTQTLQVKAVNSRSLTCKWLGLYKVITALVCHAYGLEVHQGARWHNVGHTTLFRPF